MKQLILASQSPRRSEILKKASYHFVSLPIYVSEILDKNLSLNDQILDVARRKAQAAFAQIQLDKSLAGSNSLILTADTMVCIENEALGKPENDEMAFSYLRLLSGKAHQVKTAVCLLDLRTEMAVSHLETTNIYFKSLTDQQIREYIATKEPMDKAGAYAIQGIGGQFVEKFEGDFNNVVGLPLQAVENLFKLNSWSLLKVQ